MSPSEPTPYEVLNVSPHASMDEINGAYRKLAQLYHPDKVVGLAPEFRNLAEQRMKAINTAYEQLRDGVAVPPPTVPKPYVRPIVVTQRAPQRSDYVQTVAFWWVWIFGCLLCATLALGVSYAVNGIFGLVR